MPGFEDLEVWKRSARLSADIYKTLATLKDFGFKRPDNEIRPVHPLKHRRGIWTWDGQRKSKFFELCKRICWRTSNSNIHWNGYRLHRFQTGKRMDQWNWRDIQNALWPHKINKSQSSLTLNPYALQLTTKNLLLTTCLTFQLET